MRKFASLLVIAVAFLAASGGLWSHAAHAAPTVASIDGEIERITIDNPADPWTGGTIVVGGQVVIIPKNLLMDLPANRLTLKQLFDQAPAACVLFGETGLAKKDSCNRTGAGGFATIAANRTNGNNIIAGDIFIAKGRESVNGAVTYIDYNDGYIRLNGNAGDPATGVMVRLNDPSGRHTVQRGAGCASASNCSADPRFTLDSNNYTANFTTGYPVCIPSTVARTFDGTAVGLPNPSTAQATSAVNGAGDVLCPLSNRPGQPVADSRVLAPILMGDTITAEGNWETVNGVRFISAHTMMDAHALTTQNIPTQPDYITFDEAFIDNPGFQNQRARALFIGFSTLAPADVLLWSLHYDPVTNQPHELPLGSTSGCDAAAGPSTCTGQGIIPGGGDIFRIRYDVDFGVGAKPRLDPCAHINADRRLAPAGVCPGGSTVTNMFAILSPIPHEIQARTGQKVANPGLTTLDINGNVATNGQYLFPFGIGLGGIDIPNFFEINIDQTQTPFSFSGIPWNLDRRLSPGGCIDTTGDGVPDCEAAPQPLIPFPFEGTAMDPRLQAPATALSAGLPQGPYSDPAFTSTLLTRASNRILSFVTAAGIFGGDGTVLAWPPADPAATPIPVTPALTGACFVLPGAPTVNTLTPANGSPGNPIVIAGFGFSNAAGVSFNGMPALFSITSDTQITASVPAGATTGPVTVTTMGGVGTGPSFTVNVAPTITLVSPDNGAVAAPVTITGTGFVGVTALKFNGLSQPAFIVVGPTTISTTVPAGASTGPITVTTAGGTATSAAFTVSGGPVVLSFSPSTAAPGETVTITGSGFLGVTSVTFSGTVPAIPGAQVAAGVPASFTVVSDAQITATVPVGAITGPISVASPAGAGTTATNLTVPATPAISGFTPASGNVGVSLTINGANFTGATVVAFNGTAATTWSVLTDTTISATVPVGATTGKVSVTTPAGTATSTADFTVTVLPAVSGFTPVQALPGTSVTITGSGFTGATSVKFNATTQGVLTVNSDTSITAAVPAAATSGPISVTGPGGTGLSAANFTVLVAPTITGFTPAIGPAGTNVTINGSAFGGASFVSFNGTAAVFTVNAAGTSISTTVPAGATSGTITVTTAGGTATSAASFTATTGALPVPAVTSFTPNQGNSGTTVVITGTGFTGATSVAFGVTAARSFVVNSDTQITAVVGTGTVSNVTVRVTTPGGTGTSTGTFKLKGKAN